VEIFTGLSIGIVVNSTGKVPSQKESDARKLLKQRLGEMSLGKLLGPIEERVTFDDLAVDYLQDYALKGQRSSRWAQERVKHLQRYLSDRPHIPRLQEAQPRQGFVEYAEYWAIRECLPHDYQDVLDFGYYSGWRCGEIGKPEWQGVDLKAGVVRL
jgi:hypothetical protein